MKVGHVFQSVANSSFASYEKIRKVVDFCGQEFNETENKRIFISLLYFKMNLFGILSRKPLDSSTHQNIIFNFYIDRFVLTGL